ncbi:kelch domain protein with possible IPT/TIG domain [Acrasis kona]|uniref:Kelch domain protein with possible IPT/TIG domain n=1 Tax=Acrasis kona TaxID=1008807 RepID=A0AAW2YYG6_9EUKA
MSLQRNYFGDCVNLIANPQDSYIYPSDNTLVQCSSVKVTLFNTTFTANSTGDLPIYIINPAPFISNINQNGVLTISKKFCPPPPPPPFVPPSPLCPVIKSFDVIEIEGHTTFCASPVVGATQSVNITGTNLVNTTKVSLVWNSTLVFDAVDITYQGGNDTDYTITVAFSRDLPNGTYSLIVEANNLNASVCNQTSAFVNFIVYPVRYFIYPQPPVVYNGIITPVGLHTVNFNFNFILTFLLKKSADGTQVAYNEEFTADYDNKVTMFVPDTFTNGTYQPVVVADDGCGTQPYGPDLFISDNANLQLSSIYPTIVSTSAVSTVRVNINKVLPRAHVYISLPGSGKPAILLSGIVITSSGDQISGDVLPTTPAGVYDVVVVNMDGTVGVGKNLLTVTTAVPPVVYSASYSSPVLSINGANFEGNPSVNLQCENLDGSSYTVGATVNSASSNAISVNADIAVNSVCQVIVTNPGSKLNFIYSRVVNFAPTSSFKQASNLPSGVNRPAVVATGIKPSATYSRPAVVYSIGGSSNGAALPTVNSATASTATTNAIPSVSAWSAQPSLPVALSGHSATIVNDYIYVTGGVATAVPTGNETAPAEPTSSASTGVYRSLILNPNKTPTVALPASHRDGNATGVGEANFYYAITAVYSNNSDINPGGESLIGNIQNIYTPPVYPSLVVELAWDQVPGAASYNVYRTPYSEAPSSLLALLSNTEQTKFVDKGELQANGKKIPVAGSIGNWVKLEQTLTTPRSNLAVTSLNQAIYAIGGDDLASYEFATVTSTESTGPKDYERQTLSSFTQGASSLPSTRSNFGATTYNNRVLVGPSATDNKIYASSAASGGDLGSFTTNSNQPSGDLSNSCLVSSNNKLLVVAKNNVASSTCAGSDTCDQPFQSSSQSPATSTSNPGCAQSSSTLFVVGGENNARTEYALF